MPAPPTITPEMRVREQAEALRGKKVLVATRDFHHVCGVIAGFEPPHLLVKVGGKDVRVEAGAIVTISEVTPHHAEYVY